MNNQVVLRVRYAEGQNRLVLKASNTFGELLSQISQKTQYHMKDLIIETEDRKPLNVSENKKLYEVPYFKDGAILMVSSKAPKRKQATVNPPIDKKPSINQPKQEEEQKSKPKCSHGPNGKCLNCTVVETKDTEVKMKWLCQHGPNGKCVHCLDKEYIGDVAHISFDGYLEEKKLKCKGVHATQVKCNNCLPPSKIRYQVDRNCKNHEPYPKAMCNKCIPPNVVVKRQEYRHVDYVQFMNIGEIGSFVKYWVQKKHMAEQRVGYLYGYYAEDPNYKGGIRVIVEAIYQPPQKGTYNSFQILNDKIVHHADIIANSLSLERVGWIYTEGNHDVVMAEPQVRMAARMQEEYRVTHSSGYEISNFITVILRSDAKNPGDVKPQVYMISDQGQALEKIWIVGRFTEQKINEITCSIKVIIILFSISNKEALPGFICGGKPVTQFQPQFLLVKIAHGSSKNNKFAILKKSQFPAINRDNPSKKDFQEYLKKNKHKSLSHLKYGDFNFLLYLAQILDVETAVSIAEEVKNQGKVAETIDELIEHKADL